jgi:type I restriction enzyme S subunit
MTKRSLTNVAAPVTAPHGAAPAAKGLGRFKPYPAYKDSGVEWLGEIPAHWEVKPLKRLAAMRAGSAITSESIEPDGDYPVFGGNGIRGFTDSFTHEGDLPLIGRQGALCGCVTLASGKFWASEHAVVVRPAQDVDAFWLAELLRSMSLNSYSQSAAQPGISIDTIGAILVPTPPLVEQRAIAAFLDRETAKIDALVAKKERLISLLQEKRTALISHAVTKGLDPSVPMKDSGVEWLGEIPAHWQVKRLKHVSVVENSGAYGAEPGEGAVDLPVCTTAHLTTDGRFLVDEMPVRGFSMLEATLYVGVPGDIFVVKSSGSNTNIISGKLGLVTETTPKLVFSNFLMRIRPQRSSVFPEFLAYLLRSELTRQRIQRMVATTTYPNIDVPEYVGSAIAIPPLPEQRAIAAFLDRETAKIDALIARVREAIERLKEYRTALISAAVTGKIDVREAVSA